jgi:hypothetical protein
MHTIAHSLHAKHSSERNQVFLFASPRTARAGQLKTGRHPAASRAETNQGQRTTKSLGCKSLSCEIKSKSGTGPQDATMAVNGNPFGALWLGGKRRSWRAWACAEKSGRRGMKTGRTTEKTNRGKRRSWRAWACAEKSGRRGMKTGRTTEKTNRGTVARKFQAEKQAGTIKSLREAAVRGSTEQLAERAQLASREKGRGLSGSTGGTCLL